MLGLWDLDLQVSCRHGVESPERDYVHYTTEELEGVEMFKLICCEPQMMNMEL